MKLRIIAGRLKGRSVAVGRSAGSFRPTLQRHRESIVQILARWNFGGRAADVCAGSGICGFELLSRGAAHVDFVERDRRRCDVIEQAARELGVAQEISVYCMDARRFASLSTGPYEIVYFDPPYEDESLARAVPALLTLVATGGVLAHERSARRGPCAADANRSAQPAQTRIFGTSAVDFYTPQPP